VRFSTIALGVSDLVRALAFYTDGLGFGIDSRPQPGLIYLATGETRIALFPSEQLAEYAGVPAAPPAGVVLSMNVESAVQVDAFVERALEHGGSGLRPPAEMDWGGYAATVRDPDGHVWEIVWAGPA
jgi:predicted lactoylglutathione lyase